MPDAHGIPPARAGSGEWAVRADGLAIGHERTVIDDASFRIPTGAVAAVIGPNGSGKSTLLHAIAGLLQPRAGALEVLGTAPAQAQPQVSYVLQGTQVSRGTPITVRETVRMARYRTTGILRRMRPQDHERVRSALAELEIEDLGGRHLSELSGGQRQRAFVAQAIAQDHAMLLMDEPLTGLDLTSTQAIDRLIHAEADRGCTVIITTHDLDEARAADYVLLLGAGRIVAGQPQEVLTTASLTRAYGLGLRHPTHPMDTQPPTAHHGGHDGD
ncbi:MAG: metal ABC transporter ATP-binding protein [Actinomycetales bacterium]|nr:metal ABC transporter ATP-binding protein [Actinomycetales bacterium]